MRLLPFVSADVGRALKLVDPYVEALLEEVRRTGQVLEQAGLRVRTLYVGAGLPPPSPHPSWTACWRRRRPIFLWRAAGR